MIKKLMGTKTLDSILSSFTKTMEELKRYAEQHAKESQDKLIKVQQLHNEITTHDTETLNALNVHTNLQTLLTKGKI